MTDDLMIIVAPVPGEKQDERFPGTLDLVTEVVECEAAGAAMTHLHARDEGLLQTVDPTILAGQVRRIREACPIIIEGSTGGSPEHTLDQRSAIFGMPGIEMGTVNLGSINMYDGVYQNSIEDMRFYALKLRASGIAPSLPIFDLSHFANYHRMLDEGAISPPLVFELVFDVPAGLPYSDAYLELFVNHLPDGATWFCSRYHQRGAIGLTRVAELGGNFRVGYEDGPFLSDGRRARNNMELVEDAVAVAERAGRKVVRGDQARQILGLPSFRGLHPMKGIANP